MRGGTYTLILKLNEKAKIEVGKLGILEFKKGYYAYTGSALGRAGFKRIARHFDVASGRKEKKRWHIDYLLPYSEIVEVLKLEDSTGKRECEIASQIGRSFKAVKDFGSTDCNCEAHLHYSPGKKIFKIAEAIYPSHRRR